MPVRSMSPLSMKRKEEHINVLNVTKVILTEMLSNYHTGTHKPVTEKQTCDLCGSQFSSKGTLVTHNKLIHSDVSQSLTLNLRTVAKALL